MYVAAVMAFEGSVLLCIYCDLTRAPTPGTTIGRCSGHNFCIGIVTNLAVYNSIVGK
jgi:hypothetical protein